MTLIEGTTAVVQLEGTLEHSADVSAGGMTLALALTLAGAGAIGTGGYFLRDLSTLSESERDIGSSIATGGMVLTTILGAGLLAGGIAGLAIELSPTWHWTATPTIEYRPGVSPDATSSSTGVVELGMSIQGLF
ncbi:MAG: hypothetical protein AAGN82_00005 [Myxococcota bacterium]